MSSSYYFRGDLYDAGSLFGNALLRGFCALKPTVISILALIIIKAILKRCLAFNLNLWKHIVIQFLAFTATICQAILKCRLAFNLNLWRHIVITFLAFTATIYQTSKTATGLLQSSNLPSTPSNSFGSHRISSSDYFGVLISKTATGLLHSSNLPSTPSNSFGSHRISSSDYFGGDLYDAGSLFTSKTATGLLQSSNLPSTPSNSFGSYRISSSDYFGGDLYDAGSLFAILKCRLAFNLNLWRHIVILFLAFAATIYQLHTAKYAYSEDYWQPDRAFAAYVMLEAVIKKIELSTAKVGGTVSGGLSSGSVGTVELLTIPVEGGGADSEPAPSIPQRQDSPSLTSSHNTSVAAYQSDQQPPPGIPPPGTQNEDGTSQEEPRSNIIVTATTFMMVSTTNAGTIVTSRLSAGNSLSENDKILLASAMACCTAGFLLCFGGYMFDRRRRAKLAGLLTGMGVAGAIFGFILTMSTIF